MPPSPHSSSTSFFHSSYDPEDSSESSESSSSSAAFCGDGILQDERGEECDILDADGNIDRTQGCKPDCTWTQCADGVDNDNDGFIDGGNEVNDGDGGCSFVMCNLASGHNKADDDEWNPCAKGEAPAGYAFPYGTSIPRGIRCSYDNECAGYSGQSGAIRCSSNGCIDLSLMAGEAGGANLAGQVGAVGGFNPPICPPDNCGGQVVGFPGECIGGEDGATCVEQAARRECLLQSAQRSRPGFPNGACPNGQIREVVIPGQWSCSQGVGAELQWMCGPVGQWKCFCPGDPIDPLFQQNLQKCPNTCGNGQRDHGEECDDGNQDNGDACSNTCKDNGGQCPADVDDCANGGDAFCAADGGKICKSDPQFPCIKCVEPMVGTCDGTECANGGDEYCANPDGDFPGGMECSLIDEGLCLACIPPNSCGNGDINFKNPVHVDEGCELSGTANQLCMPKGVDPASQGQWLPHHQCFQTAHCQNVGGACAWENTPELEQCIEDHGGGLPEGCVCEGGRINEGCTVRFSQDPCVRLPGIHASAQQRLAAQAIGGEFVMCPTDIKRCCGNDGEWYWVDRQPPHCVLPECEDPDGSSCAATPPRCVRAGCNGTQCVPEGTATSFNLCTVDLTAACYDAHGDCRRTAGGGCGWAPTPALEKCLNNNAGDTPCATGESCLSTTGCADINGSPTGTTCGVDNTKVCCAGGDNQPPADEPMEQCDDGNRIDGDACGNDCEINCKKHADCKGGAACVNGDCVNQCVAPQLEGEDVAGDPAANSEDDTNDEGRLMAQQMARSFNLLP